MIKKYKKNEKGFALPIALLVLVVMSIMAATLVTITSKDHAANNNKDSGQQAFYAAESGIAVAKKWMIDNKNLLVNPSNLSGNLTFCKASFFPNINTSYGFNSFKESLNTVISASGDEATRLSKYSFEYFITYSPDKNGNTSSAMKKTGTNQIYYTIFSCGCNANKSQCRSDNNIIIPLEAVVTMVN